jgi:chemotaxis protein methyltransferase CheR
MIAPEDYRFLQDFLRREMGNQLAADREDLVTNRLGPIAASYGLEGVPALLKRLRDSPDQAMRQSVIEAMATRETYFFRSTRLFDSLRQTVIPSLLVARAGARRLRIWCAACSTGQEPYSIAMTLADHFPQLAGWQVEILGTDIAETLLERARGGTYSQFDVQRGLPVQLLLRHFAKTGEGWQIAEALRGAVEFRRFNLLDSFSTLGGPFDVIFVRNVLIYFDGAAKTAIFERLRQCIAADGYLALGESETIIGLTEHFVIPDGHGDFYRPLCR